MVKLLRESAGSGSDSDDEEEEPDEEADAQEDFLCALCSIPPQVLTCHLVALFIDTQIAPNVYVAEIWVSRVSQNAVVNIVQYLCLSSVMRCTTPKTRAPARRFRLAGCGEPLPFAPSLSHTLVMTGKVQGRCDSQGL